MIYVPIQLVMIWCSLPQITPIFTVECVSSGCLLLQLHLPSTQRVPDSKVHGANMGPPGSCRPTLAPCRPHKPCYLEYDAISGPRDDPRNCHSQEQDDGKPADGKGNNNSENYPDSKVHGANMEPIWDRQGPGGPHVGPMNLSIWI